MSPALDIARSRAFEHPAMNTLFRIRLPGWPDPAVVGPAVGACFVEVERLEQLLSRYLEDSDISRLNALADGESLFIHEDTHAILLECLSLHSLTGGLFDVTLGVQTMHHRRHGVGPPPPPVAAGGFAIDPNRPLVTRIGTGRNLDLGGVGKGFALDRMARVLEEHGIGDALLQAGASTILSRGGSPWRISLGTGAQALEILLRGAALSTSGSGIQGAHVLLPDGTIPPTCSWLRTRILAAHAATADALSTAAFLMSESALRDFAANNASSVRVWAERDGNVLELP